MNSKIINKDKFLQRLDSIGNSTNLMELKIELSRLESSLRSFRNDDEGLINIDDNGNSIRLKESFIEVGIKKIKESKSIDRAKHYIERFRQGIEMVKTNGLNEINLNRWEEYEDILTDSLWIIPKRDSSGLHSAWYWGNFIPQIPYQMMRRFTKSGEWVLDPFVGSGTTLLECKKLNRNGIGIDINGEIVSKVCNLINFSKDGELPYQVESDKPSTRLILECADSSELDFVGLLNEHSIKSIQLAILHPPYHDIIKFGKHKNDLSNQASIDNFLSLFGRVVDNCLNVLDKDRFLVVVIGDKYSGGEWIPLGFYVMQEVMKRDFQMKSIIVKNFEDTAGKRNQKELWRYRALSGGFYIFKHEYILVFKKGRKG